MDDDVNRPLMMGNLRLAQDANADGDAETCLASLMLVVRDLQKIYSKPTEESKTGPG